MFAEFFPVAPPSPICCAKRGCWDIAKKVGFCCKRWILRQRRFCQATLRSPRISRYRLIFNWINSIKSMKMCAVFFSITYRSLFRYFFFIPKRCGWKKHTFCTENRGYTGFECLPCNFMADVFRRLLAWAPLCPPPSVAYLLSFAPSPSYFFSHRWVFLCNNFDLCPLIHHFAY